MLHELDDMFKTMLKFDKAISWILNIKSCLNESCNYSCGHYYEFYNLDEDYYEHELDGNNGYFLYEIINDDDEVYCCDDLSLMLNTENLKIASEYISTDQNCKNNNVYRVLFSLPAYLK